ncbi:MAG: tRNA pseudouridine(38-40) synthase TruA [Desulfarculales bacterium]|jgi:tRNA pseudouridine38-40 synthase|nr:tRNA pseudouridine(38-40) synthase TruA [Desulfarculales bacterium]
MALSAGLKARAGQNGQVSMELFLTRLWGRFPVPAVPFLDQDLAAENGRRHLALVLAYQGSEWAGWQIQPGLPTVQEAVEKALSRLCAHPVRAAASGRTDAGVHAWGQVAGFSTVSRLPAEAMLQGLRRLLPPSVFPLALGPVAPGFHARYSAQSKTYDYYLAPAMNCPVFLRSFLWPLPGDLREEPVRAALTLCLGDTDMRALSSGPPASSTAGPGANTVRRIMEARLDISPGLWRVRVTASGFLRHAMRNLVGILVRVGQGKLSPGQLVQMLTAGEKLYSAPKAPPAGLYLQKVRYAPHDVLAGG